MTDKSVSDLTKAVKDATKATKELTKTLQSSQRLSQREIEKRRQQPEATEMKKG